MTGETRITTDHDEIRRWAEERGGTPAAIRRDELNPSSTILQIDFLHEKYNDNVRAITWDEFFETLDREDLVLVHQDETEGGKLSRFARIVNRRNVEQAVIE